MRSILRSRLLASLTLAFPLAAGCSGQNVPVDPGAGGAVIDPGGEGAFAVTTVGSGIFEPPVHWTKQYGDAADQKAGAFAMNEAGEIALTGSARGTIDFGNIPWTGSTTDSDVVVAKISTQGQSLWSRRYGDSCDQHGRATAHTPTGNVLIAGDFCGKMDFGNTTVEAAAGEVDIFVAVIDDIGEDVYSLRIGGAGPQIARAAAVDAKGNAILVGSFEKAFDDGSGSVVSAGMDDAFVIKLDPAGKVLWSRRFGGPEADVARAVAMGVTGNLIVGGSFGGSVDFGGGPIAAAPGHSSAFVMALDPQGKPLWSQSFPGDDEAVVNALAVGPSGMVAATGSFKGTADFGSGPAPSAGAEDTFLAMIDSKGKPLWGLVFGGAKSQSGTGVAFGPNDDVAISITSQEPIDFSLEPQLSLPTSATPELLYFARFSTSGTPRVGRVLGSTSPMESVGVGLDKELGSVLVGSFQGTLESQGIVTPSAGGWDVFVSKN